MVTEDSSIEALFPNSEQTYQHALKKQLGQLTPRTFHMLESLDSGSGLLAIAHFLCLGLTRGETVALVTHENPKTVAGWFAQIGLDAEKHLRDESLLYFYYKPTFHQSLNISANYETMFTEIHAMTPQPISRLAFLNAETLFNLESLTLAYISAEKLLTASSRHPCITLGQTIQLSTHASQHLQNASASVLGSYLRQRSGSEATQLDFSFIKQPTALGPVLPSIL